MKLTVTGANSYAGIWVSISDIEIICAGNVSYKVVVNDTTFDFKVYPNPFSTTVTIQGAANLIIDI